MLDAKHLPDWAKYACKTLHFTPRTFENVNANQSANDESKEFVILRIHNSKRSIELTNLDRIAAEQAM